MVRVAICTPPWWEDPSVLVTDSWIAQWKRSSGRSQCFSEQVNALTRTTLAILFFAFLFSLYNNDLLTTMAYSIVLGLIITLPDIIDMVKAPYIQEQFVDHQDKYTALAPTAGADEDDTGLPLTMPTPRNPFMNVLPDEVKYNPNRPEAASVDGPVVKATLDDFFRVNWFSDPTDVFGRNQSQREFITMPSTTIPSDRESYQNWLYKVPGKTCKEGGREACYGATEGGVVPWLNNAF